jgi:hypothetical protein
MPEFCTLELRVGLLSIQHRPLVWELSIAWVAVVVIVVVVVAHVDSVGLPSKGADDLVAAVCGAAAFLCLCATLSNMSVKYARVFVCVL